MFESIQKDIEDNYLITNKRYTLKDFYKIDDFLSAAPSKELEVLYKEIKALQKSGRKLFENIRYLLIFILYKKDKPFQEDLASLMEEFESSKRYPYMLHILDKLFVFSNNTYILKLLLKYQIKAEVPESELVKTQEQLLKLDINNHELIYKIADMKKHLGQKQEAVAYYKMAFYRCVELKETELIKRILDEIITLGDKEESFYLSFLRNIQKFSEKEFKSEIYKKIFLMYFKEDSYVNIALDVMGEIIEGEMIEETADFPIRQYFLEMVQKRYTDHQGLSEVIDFSRLNKNWSSLREGYDIFKQMIRYEVGRYVFHQSFGYGVIRKLESPSSRKIEQIEASKINVDFDGKSDHAMSVRIANKSLKILPREHLMGMFLFDRKKVEALKSIPTQSLVDKILFSLDKEKDINSIKSLVVKVFPDVADVIFKKIQDELENNDRYVLKNKEYTLNDETSQKLIEQYVVQKNSIQKMEIAKIIFGSYPKSQIVEHVKKDYPNLLENTEEKMMMLLYGKYFQNRKVEIEMNLQDIFNELYKKVDGSFFETLPHPFGRIYMDFIQDHPKKSRDIKEIFQTTENEQHFYYIDLVYRKKGYKELEATFLEVAKLGDEQIDNYFMLIQHFFKNFSEYGKIDKTFIFNTLIDRLDQYYKKDDIEDKRRFLKIKQLLFDSDFYDYVQEVEEGKTMVQRLLQFNYLDDYIKSELRAAEVKLM